MPIFKGVIHVRVKKRIYPGLGEGSGVCVWGSVTQQVDGNRIPLTALLWLVSPHRPAVAAGLVCVPGSVSGEHLCPRRVGVFLTLTLQTEE